MFWDDLTRRPSRSRFTLAALAGAALVLPAAAMAGVVVKSSGPSAGTLKVGTKVEDGSTISLKAGDNVTVLTSRGTQVLKGAGTFTIGAKPKEPRMRFANFTRQGAAGRVRTGAVRTGDAGEPERPNMWYVDLTEAGTTCLYDFTTVRLWRPDTAAPATYTMVEPEKADAVEIHFETGESERVLNSERLLLAEGRTYAVRAASEGEPVTMRFALVGEYETPEELAEMLLAKGCEAQLALMADRLEADAE
ncbi:hypothetical protein [Erythrobacter sp. HL-111]|uniref:hypothetical protein n=1 Tax=Erythrobacter sp. HL-111 TaxID=1798193 RepID=UPI0006DB84EA|nr:hypothetical protein [Erythrobacter sp. HL-111]KPP92185.1 MAG: hypothetical protein HLUCCO15_07805 [Erythrobacteraceae bacterium HL-111]SDS38549.1 hypothetical protein SAMN04515621_1470 [Erythrobacter sp. HL-111]